MKKHWFPLCLIALSLICWFLVWDKLPSSLPTHWGWNGKVDRTSTVISAFLLTNGLLIGFFLLMATLPKIDPRRKNYPKFIKTYHVVVDSIVSMFFLISVGTLAIGLGWGINMATLIAGVLGMFFIIFGLLMHKVEQNYFIGVRTPWTLANKVVWKKTHQLGGNLFFLAGVLTTYSAVFTPNRSLFIMLISVILAIIISVVYSYVIFSKSELEE